jgi:hypothetical protein
LKRNFFTELIRSGGGHSGSAAFIIAKGIGASAPIIVSGIHALPEKYFLRKRMAYRPDKHNQSDIIFNRFSFANI